MSNQIKRTKGQYGAQILYTTSGMISVGVQVSPDVYVMEGNKRVIKAGTPLTGTLMDRLTPYEVADGTFASGVLLHDIEVISGKQCNGSLVIAGAINWKRLDPGTQALITLDVQQALAGSVFFVN